jgi:hypothetical protein
MNRFFANSLLLALTTFIGAVGLAAAEDAVYSCTNADGSVELAGAPNGNNCEKLVSAPDAASAATPAQVTEPGSAANQAVAATPNTTSAKAALVPPPAVTQVPRTPVEDRLSQYRDAMVDRASTANPDTQQPSGPTSASSRRYLMTNRAAYQQALGISPQ